jgi:2-oxo-4-hydroxy-4-carboxy-5-ureidoimidazoline decarboxylase
MTLDELNRLDRDSFVARFGFLFEHSPWIVAEAADHRPFADLPAMLGVLTGILDAAAPKDQLALLRAHPQLADKVAMTKESTHEQASAGLDRLSEAEFNRFHKLNDAYYQRFGFPFIICVRLTDKAGILQAMEQRGENSPEQELRTALSEVGKIVELRLKDAVSE